MNEKVRVEAQLEFDLGTIGDVAYERVITLSKGGERLSFTIFNRDSDFQPMCIEDYFSLNPSKEEVLFFEDFRYSLKADDVIAKELFQIVIDEFGAEMDMVIQACAYTQDICAEMEYLDAELNVRDYFSEVHWRLVGRIVNFLQYNCGFIDKNDDYQFESSVVMVREAQ